MVQAWSILKGTSRGTHTQGHRPPWNLNAAAPNCWMFYDRARFVELLWVMNQKLLDGRQPHHPHWWMAAFCYTAVEKVDPWKLLAWHISPVQDCLALQNEKDPGHSWSQSWASIQKGAKLVLQTASRCMEQERHQRSWGWIRNQGRRFNLSDCPRCLPSFCSNQSSRRRVLLFVCAIFYARCCKRKMKESDTKNKNGEEMMSLCGSDATSSALCSSKPLAPLWSSQVFPPGKLNFLYRY